MERNGLTGPAKGCLTLGYHLAAILLASQLCFNPPQASGNTCPIHPVGISAQAIAGKPPGAIIDSVPMGVVPGSFGWLSWGGSPGTPALIQSLTPPGDSSTYVNPDDPSDAQISLGDWIHAKPGVSNSQQVRTALDALRNLEIIAPVWKDSRGQGEKAAYRVWAFARVELLDYHLPNENRITFRFLGYATCNDENLPPVIDAGPDHTLLIGETAQLNGSATDDGLPAPGNLTVWWTQTSGPVEVEFEEANNPVTTVTFVTEGVYVLRLNASDGELSSYDESP
jgi:hypothetical protein